MFTRRLGALAWGSTEPAQPRRCPAPHCSFSSTAHLPEPPPPPSAADRTLTTALTSAPLPSVPGNRAGRGGAGRPCAGGRGWGPCGAAGEAASRSLAARGRCWARGREGKEEPASAWRGLRASCVWGPGCVPQGAMCGPLLRSPMGYT